MIASAPARAEVIHGHVHDDANHPIAHAVVAFGGSVFGETDATGAFSLDVGSTKGVVWVRVPEGYVPGPVWAAWPGPAELVVHRLAHPATQPLQFVVGSDAHLSEAQTSNGAEDLAMAIRHATESAPAFFSVLGDVTQGGTEAEFDLVEQALPELAGVPWVPVPGNHDWYDGGVAWTKRAGPDNYSFDLAGVHFVVWNMAIAEAQILAFLRGDLSRAKAPIIALTHAPPSKTMRAVLAAHHVGYVLTGHAHSNRLVHHEDGLVEFNTEPLLMGGLDFTPAGYRIFTLDHDQLHSQHRVTLDHSITSVLAPRCIQRELLVAATTPTVTARIDSGTPIAMRSVGGWDWRAELPALAPGPHRVEVNGTTSEIHACEPLAAPAAPNGGLTTSLATRWITPVGGHLLSARPVISGDTIFATVTDLGDGDRGGVIAIDLATGAVRWRTALPIQTRGGVAVVGNIVAVPQIDGVVIGLDATTGLQRWSYELRPHTAPEAQATFASITADGDDVLIGQQRSFAVIDAADGHPRWHDDPVPEGENSQSLAAVAVGDGVVVGTFNRLFGGVQAWDRATGQPLWQLEGTETVAINATPVIAEHTLFVVNAADQVTAIELATGEIKWRAALDPAGFEWGNATIAVPAYAHGILIVPTLYRDVVALDAKTGAELWRHHALPSPIRATHYRGAHEAGYESSPIIEPSGEDDRVWIADTSGELAALDLKTGAPLFRTAIGAPVLAGLAVSGASLVVASFDGTIRVLSPAPALPHVTAPIGCAATTPDLCGLLLVLGFALRSRRG